MKFDKIRNSAVETTINECCSKNHPINFNDLTLDSDSTTLIKKELKNAKS